MKKIVLLWLTIFAIATFFVGCGKEENNTDNPSNPGEAPSYVPPARHLSKIDASLPGSELEYQFTWDGSYLTQIDVYHKALHRLDLTYNIIWDGNRVIKTILTSPHSTNSNVTTFIYNGGQLVKTHSTYMTSENEEMKTEVTYQYSNGMISKIIYPEEIVGGMDVDVSWHGNNIASESMMGHQIYESIYDNKVNPLQLPVGVINYATIEGKFWEGVNHTLGYLYFLKSVKRVITAPICWSENNIVKTVDYAGKESSVEYQYDGNYPISMTQTYEVDDNTESVSFQFYYAN